MSLTSDYANSTYKSGAQIRGVALMLWLFVLACAITSIYMQGSISPPIKKMFRGGEKKVLGPIKVKSPNSVYWIDVKQSIPMYAWSSVSVEVLDEDEEYLMGFGDEFWAESGYDSDGSWSETYNDYRGRITLPEAGTYYLGLEVESMQGVSTPISVKVYPKRGSTIFLKLSMWLAAIAAGFVTYILMQE